MADIAFVDRSGTKTPDDAWERIFCAKISFPRVVATTGSHRANCDWCIFCRNLFLEDRGVGVSGSVSEVVEGRKRGRLAEVGFDPFLWPKYACGWQGPEVSVSVLWEPWLLAVSPCDPVSVTAEYQLSVWNFPVWAETSVG